MNLVCGIFVLFCVITFKVGSLLLWSEACYFLSMETLDPTFCFSFPKHKISSTLQKNLNLQNPSLDK
jgi:hypothetical protein